MNALDSLFDFAALMSSSSAMTLRPAYKTQNVLSQGAQRSKMLSVQGAQLPHGPRNQAQRPEPPSHTRSEAFVPLDAAYKARVPTCDMQQSALDWVPATLQLQNLQYLGHQPLTYLAEHNQDFVCSQHQYQSCQCTNIPMWNMHQPPLQYTELAPQYLQQVPDQGLPWYQPCQNQLCGPLNNHQSLPLPDYYSGGDSMPISPQDTMGDEANIGFQSYGSGRVYRTRPLPHH